MSFQRQVIPFTTSTSGSSSTYGERAVLGKLFAAEWMPNSGSSGSAASFVLTCEDGSYSKPLLTAGSAASGSTAALFYPRDLVHKVEDAAALTGTAGGDRVMPLLNGRLRLVVTGGGSEKTGALSVFVETP